MGSEKEGSVNSSVRASPDPVSFSTAVTAVTTLHGLLQKRVEADGGKVAIVVTKGPVSVTYSQLQAAVEGVAAQLRSYGIRPGDLISLAFTNTLEYVVAFLGVTRARAVAAPLNSAYTAEEFKFYFEDSKSSLLILPQEGASAAAEEAANGISLPVAKASNFHLQDGVTLSLNSGPPPTLTEPGNLASGGPGLEPEPNDVALFLHTSGTTSRPKGVPLQHKNLAASIANIIATYDLSPSDKSYLVMPLFHVHGLMAALLSQLFSGGTVILPGAAKFSATAFWQEVKDFGATWYTAVPTMHQILLARHKTAIAGGGSVDYPKLRFIRSCSASLAKAVLEEMEGAFGAPVLEAYAMTEASHQMTANPLPARGEHKANSVGKPTGIELAILDEAGKVLERGQRGEVCIKGPNVTEGYRNNPSANEQAFEYGWFHTGDQGYLDGDGYLFLTGRLKELINRGGEKISPLEVDAALLSVRGVAEAVSFSAPDPHYGEEVNAAVVLVAGQTTTEAEIKDSLKKQLATFKIPKRIFFVEQLPRTATGKIQRRFVAAEVLSKEKATLSSASAPSPPPLATPGPSAIVDGNTLLARSLARLGIKFMYGVVGIPVTAVATSAQVEGIRFIAFRNEQSAGYAASANGYLTGVPGALLTVSGPGCVHGLAGLSNGKVNTWPILMISGSSTQADVGKGDFQELDQMETVKTFVKYAGKATKIEEIPEIVEKAVLSTVKGRPGAAYIDIPADIFHQTISAEASEALLKPLSPFVPVWQLPQSTSPPPSHLVADPVKVKEAAALLKDAKSPLLVFGKGAAFARAEHELLAFVDKTKIPFLPTPMAKGLVPDSHPLSVTAARSLALYEADVALIVGARLNWILHFGEPPRWSPSVKFILVEIDDEEIALRKPAIELLGDAKLVLGQLNNFIATKEFSFELAEGHPWRSKLKAKVDSNTEKISASLAKSVHPFNFYTPLRILRDQIATVGSPASILVSEGANTMDLGRQVLNQSEARTRLDAGTWGTMGVGLGYAIAAALTNPERIVIALEGDSAFGFSGMEVETIVRYNLAIVIIVMNNGGVYGGDRRGFVSLPEETRQDPPPTSFVPNARYDLMAEAFGGKGYFVTTADELKDALKEAFASRKPALLNVVVDPMAGVESGRMTHRN